MMSGIVMPSAAKSCSRVGRQGFSTGSARLVVKPAAALVHKRVTLPEQFAADDLSDEYVMVGAEVDRFHQLTIEPRERSLERGNAKRRGQHLNAGERIFARLDAAGVALHERRVAFGNDGEGKLL